MKAATQKTGLVKKYIQLYKEHGARGFIQKAGWPVALGLFAFFLAKGLVYIALFYGGASWIKSMFS
jgi:hypothetical protein